MADLSTCSLCCSYPLHRPSSGSFSEASRQAHRAPHPSHAKATPCASRAHFSSSFPSPLQPALRIGPPALRQSPSQGTSRAWRRCVVSIEAASSLNNSGQGKPENLDRSNLDRSKLDRSNLDRSNLDRSNIDRSSAALRASSILGPLPSTSAKERKLEEDKTDEATVYNTTNTRPSHEYHRHWEFHSQRLTRGQTRDQALQKLKTKPKSVPVTVHGCVSDEDAEWLREQVLALEGVHSAFVQGRKEGGLRGGAVVMQLEVDPCVRLPSLVHQMHCIEERLLALPFKTHSWNWRGHRISYAVAGCGKPVILVHGFGGSAGHFRNLIAHLADTHRVYAVDLLGFGNSAKPADVAYGPELWADIVNDFAQEFAEEPPVLIGNSIGSLTALGAANQLAQKGSVKGLVLLNVAGAMNRKGLMQDDILLRVLSPVFVGIEFLLQRPKVAEFLFDKFRSKANVRKILAEQVYRNPTAVDDRLLDILYEPSQDSGALDVFVKVFTGESGPRPEALVKDLNVPMLILWGDSDPWTPINGKVAQLFRQLEEERENVKLVPLPDVGHCPHDDRPELAAGHILPWLQSLDSMDSAEL